MYKAVVVFPEVEKILALNQLIAKFSKAHPRLQSFFNAVFGCHVVDRNVLSNVSDEVQKFEVFEPIGIVDHPCCVLAIEVQKLFQLCLLTGVMMMMPVGREMGW